MNKSDFLSELRRGLGCLPEEDIEKSVDFYAEMIDDKMEEGLTEEEAVAEAGCVDEISAQIIAEIPLTRLVKARVKPKRALKAWEIVLIAAGSPVWLSLLVAAAVTVVSVYASLWAVIVSLYAVVLSFGALCRCTELRSRRTGGNCRRGCLPVLVKRKCGGGCYVFRRRTCLRGTRGAFVPRML